MLHNVLESRYSMLITIEPSKKEKARGKPTDFKNAPPPLGKKPAYPNGMSFLLKMTVQYTVTTGNGYNYVSNGAAGYAGMVSTLAGLKYWC